MWAVSCNRAGQCWLGVASIHPKPDLQVNVYSLHNMLCFYQSKSMKRCERNNHPQMLQAVTADSTRNKYFSPFPCGSLLCWVCFSRKSGIWDLTRSDSLWLSRSFSCGKKRKHNNHNIYFLSPQCLQVFVHLMHQKNNSPMIFCLRSGGDDLVGGQVKCCSRDERRV